MRRWRDPLMQAWAALVALSGAVTLASAWRGRAVGALILCAGAAKARIILMRYMGVGAVPAWRRFFDAMLGAVTLLMLAVYAAD